MELPDGKGAAEGVDLAIEDVEGTMELGVAKDDVVGADMVEDEVVEDDVADDDNATDEEVG